ncbi:MAG: rhomboid family intramembrane serine protease [Actinomycetota bacterium]|nr:rhomboid family intramembrane serine protease [Actinomycetota bacterium]
MSTGAPPRRGIGSVLTAGIVPVAVLLGLMWIAEGVDTVLGQRLDQLGIEPRDVDGLTGVVAAPFLHAGFGHLLANSAGLLVLGLLLAVTTRSFWLICALITVLGGLAVWVLGPAGTLHIGASGLVYGIAAYLVARGVRTRRVLDVVIAGIVVLTYSGLALGVLPGQPGVSWQSHLFGALAGVAVAWFGATPARRPRRLDR